MKRTLLAFVVAIVAGGGAAGGIACSSSSNHGSPGTDAGGDTVDSGLTGFTVLLPCTDSDQSVYADPGDVSGQPKGAILKCAKDPDLSAADLTALVTDVNDGGIAYAGKPFTSGAHVYRVLYRTERGDPNDTPGYSSALVYIPDTPRAQTLPVIIASHGSRGQAGLCAPSLDSPQGAYVQDDFWHQVIPMVGFGFTVIAPDLAGYANFGGANNPPSAYADTEDVGKSTLDAAQALRNMLPSATLTQDVVITGHSQGGHTALSALSLSSSYPVAGNIVAVAVYSPLWLSQHAWGAIFLEPGTYGFAESSAGAVSLWYHYTHSLLLDGPDAGLAIYNPATLPVLQNFVGNDCWSASYPDLEDAGANANAFFASSYVNSMEIAATPVGDGNCNGDTDCTTWFNRMTADWPHLTGNAAKVPILVWYANDDTTLVPSSMQCVFNRLSSDGTSYQLCYDPNPVGHSGVVAVNNNYVVDWIAQKTLDGGAPTEACQALGDNEAGVPQLVDEAGAPIDCNSLLLTQ